MLDYEFDVSDVSIPDTGDATDTDMLDDDHYHAERMSDEEVKRIDDMWDDSKDCSDVEPYHAFRVDELSDVEDVAMTDEEKFAAEIESMSLDELQEERHRLEELSKMSDLDIFAEYDDQMRESGLAELDAVMDDLSKDQLAELRDRLEAKDPETLEYFDISDDDTDDNPTLTLRKTH